MIRELKRLGWEGKIRVLFWGIGLTLGAALTYVSRYFVNSDAIIYMELGEMFVNGNWSGLVNLTFSPAYGVLLGIGQALLGTDPLNELLVLRVVNFLCFVFAMAGADWMISLAARGLRSLNGEKEKSYPYALFRALSYAMFLVTALTLIRVRLFNPDMLILAVGSLCLALLLQIREESRPYRWYILLGISAGVGYLCKAFFFLFAPLLLVEALLLSNSVSRQVSRVVVAAVIFAAITAPFVAALSQKKGAFTYSEAGRHIYAMEIAAQGEPVHVPEVLNQNPRVVFYRSDLPVTRPHAFDVSYWTIGIEPDYRLKDHMILILTNICLVFSQTPWLALVSVWFFYLWKTGFLRVGPLRPLSLSLSLLIPAAAGTGLFCLIRMEPRYIAPFLFIGFVGAAAGMIYPTADFKARRRIIFCEIGLIVLFIGLIVNSAIDETFRGLYSTATKLSRRNAYYEQIAVKEFLSKHGVKSGDTVAVVGNPPLYWSRMAGLKVLGEIPDRREYLNAKKQDRDRTGAVLRNAGVKAVLMAGSVFPTLEKNGWRLIPGTTSYLVLLLK